jgi:vacuolar protein sorting-associated protein 52
MPRGIENDWCTAGSPRRALEIAMSSFIDNLDLFVPGCCVSVPNELSRLMGAIVMHAFRVCPVYRIAIFPDCGSMGQQLGESLWYMGHEVSGFFHVPAVVRGTCYVLFRSLVADLSLLRWPTVCMLPSVETISKLAPIESHVIKACRAAPSADVRRWDDAMLASLHTAVVGQLSLTPSIHVTLPCAVSDHLEEVSLVVNVDNVSSKDFAAVMRRLLANPSPFVPSRLMERLVRVELAPFEDVLRHLSYLVSYIGTHLFLQDSGFCPSTHFTKNRLIPSVRTFLLDLVHVLPSVSVRDFVAFRELAQRAPRCLSSVVHNNFGENTRSATFLRWIVSESPYSLEVSDPNLLQADGPRAPLLFLPSALLGMISSSSAAERGGEFFPEEGTEIQFRRALLADLRAKLADIESTNLLLQEFVKDSCELSHLDDVERMKQIISGGPCVSNSGEDEKRRNEEACDQFVEALLGHDSSVGKLYTQVQESRTTLRDMESVLVTFLERISAVRNDIGTLRAQSVRRATMLENSTAVEKIVSEVVTHLIVPLDVVHIVSNADSSIELGPQFRHALKILHGILQERCGSATGATSVTPGNERAVKVVLSETLAFCELLGVPEDLVILACSRIKAAFDDKMAVLRRPRTNIAVQQEHILGPLHPFVRFVRVVIPLLRRSATFWKYSQHQSARVHRSPPSFHFHYNVVRKTYMEIRQSYIVAMRVTYFRNISRYLMQLKKLEDGNASSQGWNLFSSRSSAFTLPAITEISGRVTPADFGMGRRKIILENLLSHPVVPVVAASRGQQLMYEETFRSVNVMLCDVVTREFLFTFDFFGGDSTIYTSVFQSVIQYIVDYVAEMLLQVSALVESEARRDRSLSHSHFGNVVFSCSNTDVLGLLTLIRMCHLFRTNMRRVRRLECLNGYYDSLLDLLWPAFRRAFSLQIDCMRSLGAAGAMKHLASLRSPIERLAAVHPVTLRFAEFTAAVMSLTIPFKVVDAALLDAAAEDDDEDHMVALRANLSILRIEFLRMIGTVASELTREGSPLARQLSSVPIVNNLFHVITIWTLTPPLIILADGDGSSEGRMIALEAVAASPDFVALSDQLHAARAQLVEQLMRLVFPSLFTVLLSTATSDDVLAGAKQYSESWQSGVVEAHRQIVALLAHQKNQQETFPQFCMQLLLYNTRAHARVAQFADGNSLKAILVTNHQLMQFMRTFAHVSFDEQKV